MRQLSLRIRFNHNHSFDIIHLLIRLFLYDMTKKLVKKVPLTMAQAISELLPSQFDLIQKNFDFLEFFDFRGALSKLHRNFQSLVYLESKEINNVSLEHILIRIKNETERFLKEIKPFLVDPELMTKRLYYLKKELSRFLSALELIERQVAYKIAGSIKEINIESEREKSWPERRRILTSNIRDLFNLVDFHTLPISKQRLEPLTDNIIKLETCIPIAEELLLRTKNAINNHQQDKAGRKQNIPINNLIYELVKLYEGGTNSKATISWNVYKTRYQSKFLDFVQHISELFGASEEISISRRTQRILVSNSFNKIIKYVNE